MRKCPNSRVALNGDKEIGEKINKLLAKLAEANGLQGVINLTDFNDEEKLGKGKDMVDRLTKLVRLFDNPSLNFSGNRAEGDDLLGDAYEFLIRHFATESGKSKGSFYTPAEVSRIVAKVIGVGNATDQAQTIYDPTCGSGSLLLKAHDEATYPCQEGRGYAVASPNLQHGLRPYLLIELLAAHGHGVILPDALYYNWGRGLEGWS